MPDWTPIEKPAKVVEERLLKAILEGYFPGNAKLPGERQFALQIGVTRPTLREALQRLARDGWLDIRHGRPTRVRDYLTEGNLGILSSIARYPDSIPSELPMQTLAMRAVVAPVYIRLAVANLPLEVASATSAALRTAPEGLAFAVADWGFHYRMSVAGGNPVYTMILNSISELVIPVLQNIFDQPEARDHILAFYTRLGSSALDGNAEMAGSIASEAMQDQLHWYE